MSDVRAIAMPDVGEGLTEAEILRWLVRPGDVVQVNQMVVEIETAKAAVELPSPYAGTVAELHATEGTVVPVGTPIISITTQDAPAQSERQSVLVGYGVRADGPTGRRARRGSAAPAAVTSAPVIDPEPIAARPVRAKPPVRKLARDRGIDLTTLTPTGPQGEVTRADVLAATGGAGAVPTASVPGPLPSPGPRGPGHQPGTKVPVRGVHRAMAEAMVQSAFTAPHVTEWVDVDMSRSLELLTRLREDPANAEVRLTPMILVALGLVRAAQQYPMINSTWVDEPDGMHIQVHGEVNLGIAADTPRGLLVPTIPRAGGLGIVGLARAVQQTIDTARAGRSTPADLTGGTITLTNIGVFGIDGGTPILTPGQSSILAMGRILDRPWIVSGQVVARPIMQLSLSFDHRVIDGGLGSRALRSVSEFLADPALALVLDAQR